MRLKPAKYGIKFFLFANPLISYVLNISPYLGENGEQSGGSYNVGEKIVLSLTTPLHYSGRTVVADNFPSSFSLATKSLDKKFTYLGTIQQNKRELPPFFYL